MIQMYASRLASLVDGRLSGGDVQLSGEVFINSRHLAPHGIFIALSGQNSDGHRYVSDALRGGAGAAIVQKDFEGDHGTCIHVSSPLRALQQLAAWYCRQLSTKVVAITGSNGKTVTKDALAHLLRSIRSRVSVSPGSYNSQIGVALSLLQADQDAVISVFEAGISAPGEMVSLREMLSPDVGILTNIGLSHIAAFRDQEHLAREKLSLFSDTYGWVLLPNVQLLREVASEVIRMPLWSDELSPWCEKAHSVGQGTRVLLRMEGGEHHEVLLHTHAPELVEDVMMAAKAARLLGLSDQQILSGIQGYTPTPTRLEVWRSPGGVTLVNDAVSSDPLSVRAALRATAALGATGRKIFVFGGMGELGALTEREHRTVGSAAAELGFRHLLLLGEGGVDATAQAFHEQNPGGNVQHVASREELARRLSEVTRAGDVVLLKGRRAQEITEVASDLFGAMAPSRLLVDLRAVGTNIARFRSRYPGVKILAVVKALAYGSALAEMTQAIGQIPVDFLGVTTADEGVQLRASGTELPILVTLITREEVRKLPPHRLTPVLSTFSLIEPLAEAAKAAGSPLDVHLKIDTGMGRLGVLPQQARSLAEAARATGWLHVTGVMTHFSCADDPSMDDLTQLQITRFNSAIDTLRDAGFQDLLAHASASAGASRFPEAAYGMIRLGLALHGVASSSATVEAVPLELAVSLVSKIVQIRNIPRGWTVGYGATYHVEREALRMGVIPLGYHDGLPRSLSNQGWVLVEGRRAPMIGRVSMDSVLVDLSEIPEAQEGSEVLIFGRHHGFELRPEALAEAGGTIAYELLARIGPRVQRVYIGG